MKYYPEINLCFKSSLEQSIKPFKISKINITLASSHIIIYKTNPVVSWTHD